MTYKEIMSMYAAAKTFKHSHQNGETRDTMCVVHPVHIQSAYAMQRPGTAVVFVRDLMRPFLLLQHHLIASMRLLFGGAAPCRCCWLWRRRHLQRG